jgi:hypothetical protein
MTSIGFPSNAVFAFQIVQDLANLKIIPTDQIVEAITGIKNKATKEKNGYSGNIL